MKRGLVVFLMFLLMISLANAADKPVGGEAIFDGIDDYANLGDVLDFIPERSISFWFKNE